MIPVFQTIVDPNKGNCLAAALASLFEMPLEDVPNFAEMCDMEKPGEQDEVLNTWLGERGYTEVQVVLQDDTEEISVEVYRHIVSAVMHSKVKYLLAGVRSQNFPGRNHAIIVENTGKWPGTFKVAHDPCRTNKPYDMEDWKTIMNLSFIVPTDGNIIW